METERKLVTVRKISEIRAIPNADNIELAIVDGWQCVVRKDDFQVGNDCVYFEIDSFLPENLITQADFAFLSKDLREWNGKKGVRIKTIKLRKQISQGLVMNLNILLGSPKGLEVDEDLSKFFGVVKWEPIVTGGARLFGEQKGTFPSFIRKTDQERLQNMFHDPRIIANNPYEVTEKLDGSSATYFVRESKFGFCSRNFELREPGNFHSELYNRFTQFINKLFRRFVFAPINNNVNRDNVFWKIVERYNMKELFSNNLKGMNDAFQGECIGAGIQKNKYSLPDVDFYVFDIFDIKQGEYIGSSRRQKLVAELGLKHVPVIDPRKYFDFQNIEEALEYAKGKSMLDNHMREGVVFKSILNPNFSFKIINNDFLLKYEE